MQHRKKIKSRSLHLLRSFNWKFILEQCAPLLCFYFVILPCMLVTFSVIFEIEEISYRQNKLKFLTRFTNDTFHDVTMTLGVATHFYIFSLISIFLLSKNKGRREKASFGLKMGCEMKRCMYSTKTVCF